MSGDVEFRNFSNSKYYIRAEKRPENNLDSINTFTLPGSIYYNDTTQPSYIDGSGKLIEIYNQFELNLENSMSIRFGAEYTMTTKIGTIPLRGGVRIFQSPYRSATNVNRDYQGHPSADFVLGDKVTRSVFTAGTGIHWRQIWLDGSFEYSTEKQDEAGANYYGDFTTERKRIAPTIIFNFTGFF